MRQTIRGVPRFQGSPVGFRRVRRADRRYQRHPLPSFPSISCRRISRRFWGVSLMSTFKAKKRDLRFSDAYNHGVRTAFFPFPHKRPPLTP